MHARLEGVNSVGAGAADLRMRHPAYLIAARQQGDTGEHQPLREDLGPAANEQDWKNSQDDVPERCDESLHDNSHTRLPLISIGSWPDSSGWLSGVRAHFDSVAPYPEAASAERDALSSTISDPGRGAAHLLLALIFLLPRAGAVSESSSLPSAP